MIQKGQPITYTDLQAIATLANTKLGTAFAFSPFAGANEIGPPTNLSPLVVYGGTGQFSDGLKVTFKLWAYKNIGGKKTYLWQPLIAAVNGNPGSGSFSINLTWTPGAGVNIPDGYVVGVFLLSTIAWQDVGNVNHLLEDGDFSNPAWNFDSSLRSDDTSNLPCGHGIWLKTLCDIHQAAVGVLDLFGGAVAVGDAHKVTGPEIVSAGQKCYLYLNGKSVYKYLSFLYSEADSTTGYLLSREADMTGIAIGVVNGDNNFSWDTSVRINGTVTIYSAGQGQNQSDWALSASHPGITIAFNPHDFDSATFQPATAFIFTFKDVDYVFGHPVTLTVTPLSGGSVINPGSAVGGGGLVNAVFTELAIDYAATDAVCIHTGSASVPATAAKSVSISNNIGPITLTTPAGGTNMQESHWRAYCEGVYIAYSLPSLGTMSYLDVDLPQYSPLHNADIPSSRRLAMNSQLPITPVISARAALWPVLAPDQFIPDAWGSPPLPFFGSPAWQANGTLKIDRKNYTNQVNPYLTDSDLFHYFVDVGSTASDIRVLIDDPNCIVYAKAGGWPTPADYDMKAPGGNWAIASQIVPGFEKGVFWYFSIQNTTGQQLPVSIKIAVLYGGAEPYSSFFGMTLNSSGEYVPQIEGFSYHFDNVDDFNLRPIPQYGYCIYSVTVRRRPVPNEVGIATAPSIGTTDLPVHLGVQRSAGYGDSGTFENLQLITIPAGQASVTVPLFWPVLKGNFLVVQESEDVVVRASVNFQPMLHSSFLPQSDTAGNLLGYYDGPVWYDTDRMMLFFEGRGVEAAPVLLPVSASVVNDLISFLNAL